MAFLLYHVREMSTAINHLCSQIMLHPYAAKVIVAIISVGSPSLLIKQTVMALQYNYKSL